MRLFTFLISVAVAALPLQAQINALLSVAPPQTLAAKRNEVVTANLEIQLKPDHHVNSNTPSDEYLIPLRFTWTTGVAEAVEVIYPKPEMHKYSFSEKPLSVYTGDFKAQTKFKILPNAKTGASTIEGKLRYQACNDRMCFPPRTIDVKIPVEVRN